MIHEVQFSKRKKKALTLIELTWDTVMLKCLCNVHELISWTYVQFLGLNILLAWNFRD